MQIYKGYRICSKFLGEKVHLFNVILHKGRNDGAIVPRKATSYKIISYKLYKYQVN